MTRRTSTPRASTVDLASERREYMGQRLLEAESPGDPFDLFTSWLEAALGAGLLDATAMVLATATPTGIPSSRVVLLKGHDTRGLVFYTRHDAQKCVDLAANPRAACLFHWRELDRQVRVEGAVEAVSIEESRSYFASRPRSSQLAARATAGMQRVSAEELEATFDATLREWEGRDVDMPETWGGFRLQPTRFEFWQGRPNRLHDRLVYALRAPGGWDRFRLAP